MSTIRLYNKKNTTIVVTVLLFLSSFVLMEHVSASSINSPQNGVVWEKSQYSLEDADLKLRDVKFINSTHGWIVGEDRTGTYGGIVFSTNDSGESWILQLNNTSPYHSQIDILESQIIWITGQGSLFYSINGGETWNESMVVTESSGMSFVKFINDTHGWTATMGKLYMTVDGGSNWQIVSGWSFSGDVPRNMHFTSTMDIWTIGFFGIYYSSDGGVSWSQKHDEGGWALSFIDDLEAWAVADNMLAHMVDGQTWVEKTPPRDTPFSSSTPYLTDVCFIDANNGWIVGGITDDVHIIYTPNGGQDWYEQSTPTHLITRLMAVDFINITHGWAVASDGTIIRTQHGTGLGTRLWTGLTDPVFLSTAGVFAAVLVIFSGCVFYWRKKRKQR
ncbi:MAG: WD40/YVTN/BNR-like repeat-containing protein [Candidatus Thorarchaeota archaeon]